MDGGGVAVVWRVDDDDNGAAEAAAVVVAASAVVGAAAGMVGSVSQAKPSLWDPLMRKIASSNSVKEILDALKEAVGVLRSKRKDYQNEVGGHKIKVPSETYKEWIRRVMEIEDQVDNLVAKHDKESEKSSFSFSTSSTFREYLVKKHEQVIKLLKESNQIRDKLLIDQPQEPVVKMRAPDIKKFETLQKSLEQVLGLLRNDKVKGIQIHGTVGIGKTTIMLNLNNHDEVAKMFDIVIWVKVSTEGSKENLSREHLQQAILRTLKLNIKVSRPWIFQANRAALDAYQPTWLHLSQPSLLDHTN
ncbi:probable disease resistance protein At1g58602 [Camellia sinensis]|uniref:probable disease resistance protein At1g58602 n=1 Tax=Camellia sinensis TaxID=4442 RepID=UPI0010357F5C|nr:probable disease resistance protein At1g58602 [Camellia sinensis]